MKDKIINIIVIVVMVVIANYPLYKSLKSTANGLKSTSDELNVIIQTVQDEVVAWQSDVNKVQGKIEDIRLELTGTINKGINKTENVLNKVNKLESDVNVLLGKIDSLKLNTMNKVKEIASPKILNNKVDSLKIEPVKTIKDLFKIRG